jgi:hypothetical protein
LYLPYTRKIKKLIKALPTKSVTLSSGNFT